MGEFECSLHPQVWLAIVTSPRGGLQLDAWLSVMVAMDLVPLAAAAAKVWGDGEEAAHAWTIAFYPEMHGAKFYIPCHRSHTENRKKSLEQQHSDIG